MTQSDPGLSIPRTCEGLGEEKRLDSTSIQLGVSRKRLRKDIERIGRNIRQRLFCCLFGKQGCNEDSNVEKRTVVHGIK